LRSSKRLTVNVIRNQQRNRITLDETNIASSQLMEYDFSPLVGLPVPGRYALRRESFARNMEGELGLVKNLPDSPG